MSLAFVVLPGEGDGGVGAVTDGHLKGVSLRACLAGHFLSLVSVFLSEHANDAQGDADAGYDDTSNCAEDDYVERYDAGVGGRFCRKRREL